MEHKALRLIIWDEVPMGPKYCSEAVDRHLRDVRNRDLPFGGIPTVPGGDFAQILPVVRRGNRAQTVDASLQMSPLWHGLEGLTLRCAKTLGFATKTR